MTHIWHSLHCLEPIQSPDSSIYTTPVVDSAPFSSKPRRDGARSPEEQQRRNQRTQGIPPHAYIMMLTCMLHISVHAYQCPRAHGEQGNLKHKNSHSGGLWRSAAVRISHRSLQVSTSNPSKRHAHRHMGPYLAPSAIDFLH